MKNNRLTWILVFSSAVACGNESSGPQVVGGSGGATQGSGPTGGSPTSGSAGSAGPTGSGSGAAGSTMDTGGPGTGSAGTGGAGMDRAACRARAAEEEEKGGAAGTNGGGGAGPSGGCSQPIRNGVMPGKESFTVLTPSDTRFPFTKHWVGEFSADPRFIGGESLTDLDHDGDLDYAIGQRTDIGGGMVWFEYCGADQWVRHAVGTGTRRRRGEARWT